MVVELKMPKPKNNYIVTTSYQGELKQIHTSGGKSKDRKTRIKHSYIHYVRHTRMPLEVFEAIERDQTHE